MGVTSQKTHKTHGSKRKETSQLKSSSNNAKSTVLLKKRLKNVLDPSSSSKAVSSDTISQAISNKQFILQVPSQSNEFFKKKVTNTKQHNGGTEVSLKVNGIQNEIKIEKQEERKPKKLNKKCKKLKQDISDKIPIVPEPTVEASSSKILKISKQSKKNVSKNRKKKTSKKPKEEVTDSDTVEEETFNFVTTKRKVSKDPLNKKKLKISNNTKENKKLNIKSKVKPTGENKKRCKSKKKPVEAVTESSSDSDDSSYIHKFFNKNQEDDVNLDATIKPSKKRSKSTSKALQPYGSKQSSRETDSSTKRVVVPQDSGEDSEYVTAFGDSSELSDSDYELEDDSDYTAEEEEELSFFDSDEEFEEESDSSQRSCDYDFNDETDDEDYQLPEGEVEDLIIPQGTATLYNAENIIDFDDDSPQIVEIGTQPENVYSNDKQEEKNDSDDSCPQLVPINYDNYVETYDYEFTSGSEDIGDSSSTICAYDREEEKFDTGSASQQVVPTLKPDTCKLITTDGENVVTCNYDQIKSLNEATMTVTEKPTKTSSNRKINATCTQKESKKTGAGKSVKVKAETEFSKKPKKTKKKKELDEEHIKSEMKVTKESTVRKRKIESVANDLSQKQKKAESQMTTTKRLKTDQIELKDSEDEDFEMSEQTICEAPKADVMSDIDCSASDADSLTFGRVQTFRDEIDFETKSLFFPSLYSRYVLIVLKDKIYFQGTISIRLLAGSAKVFGYDLQEDEVVKSYSLRGSGFLYIEPQNSQQFNKSEDLHSKLTKYSEDFAKYNFKDIEEKFNPYTDALVLLERNDGEKKVQMIRRHMRENIFPNMSGINVASCSFVSQFILRCVFCRPYNECLKVLHEWDQLNITHKTKLMVIGGKGVGKSAFLRYQINKNLVKFKKILLIDLDIGQPEAFLSQTVSASIVDKPFLGPGNLYAINAKKAYLFGHINVVTSPTSYMKCVSELIKYCNEQQEFNDIPWVINTMGYSQGFGNELMAAILGIVEPNTVVQLNSLRQSENFACIMNPENVKRLKTGVMLRDWAKQIQNLNYEFISIQSAVNTAPNTGLYRMTAKDSRLCMILARLGDILKDQYDLLSDIVPYSISFDDVGIRTLTEDKVEDKHRLLDIIDANFIYLCTEKPNTEHLECHGMGLVRGIDRSRKEIYVVCALNQEILAEVNILAICNVPLPTTILSNQGPKIKGNIPYAYNTPKTAITKHVRQYNAAHVFRDGVRKQN